MAAFADAWNRHDVDSLMSMMTDDGIFEASGGNDVNGERHEDSRPCGLRTLQSSPNIPMPTGAMRGTRKRRPRSVRVDIHRYTEGW
jgi:hypothetical protein